mgnify:CR=1 FL=1
MKLFNRRLIVCLVLIVALAGATGAAAAEKRDGMFIHISHGAEHAHRVLMALNMAAMMAEDHPVLIYFDIKGIEVVLKDAKNITFAHFPASKDQLSTLLKKGVVIMACPGCLKAAGKTPADLAPGIQVANKKQFFSFTEGRIITLDY